MNKTAQPALRDSGISWIGKIPSHWDVRRVKWTVSDCANGIWGNEPDGVDDVVCVRVADFDRDALKVKLDAPTMRAVEPSQRESRQLRRGDLLIEKSGGGDKQLVGCVVQFDHNVEAVCSNFVARMPVESGHCARYWCYAHASLYSGRLNYPAIKQTTGIQNLDAGAYLNTLVAYPPFPEQERIASFLDSKTSQIDALIAKKRALIEKLKEKRLAVITEAVTKGLNPGVPLKESGVPWIGKVPAHWSVKRLSRITNSRCDGPFGSGLKSEHYADAGVRVIRLQNIGIARFDGSDAAFIDPDYYAELGNHDVREGDLLIAGLGDKNNPVGRACRAPDLGDAMVKADCFRYRLEEDKADAQFIAYQMSVVAEALAGAMASGVTRPRMNLSLTSERVLALPDLPEQVLIAAHLDHIWSETEAVIDKVEAAMRCIGEYRSALITAAVTGKLDLRHLTIPAVT